MKNIKGKLIMLYILNVSDIILTLLLLKTGYFQEVNILMKNVVNNNYILSLLIKIVLVGILILFILKRLEKATENQIRYSNKIITLVLVPYAIINIIHVLNIGFAYLQYFVMIL